MNVKLLVALFFCFLSVGLVFAESDAVSAEQQIEQGKIEENPAEAKKKQEEREKIEKEIRDKVEAEFQSRVETLKKEVQDLNEQLRNARTEQEKIKAEFQSEIETLKRETQDLNEQLRNARTVIMYIVCGIAIIIFFVLIVSFFRRKPSNGEGFEALIIDSVTDLLKRKMPNPSSDLKRQISDIIKHNAIPDSSLRSFARAEYNIKKIDVNNVSLTINVLYIVSPSDIVKLTSESIIRWDDLPKEIRNDFIQNRKTEQLYLIYKQ